MKILVVEDDQQVDKEKPRLRTLDMLLRLCMMAKKVFTSDEMSLLMP